MACSQTLAGIARDCASNLGGIVEVLLANAADVTITKSSDKITAITMAASAKFKKYAFRPETCSMTSNYQVNQQNGTAYVQTNLALVFSHMETAKRIEITAMAQGELVAIVKDANGLYWYLGEYEPLTFTAGGGETGTARADRNAYLATLQDNAPELPSEILTGTGGVDISALL